MCSAGDLRHCGELLAVGGGAVGEPGRSGRRPHLLGVCQTGYGPHLHCCHDGGWRCCDRPRHCWYSSSLLLSPAPHHPLSPSCWTKSGVGVLLDMLGLQPPLDLPCRLPCAGLPSGVNQHSKLAMSRIINDAAEAARHHCLQGMQASKGQLICLQYCLTVLSSDQLHVRLSIPRLLLHPLLHGVRLRHCDLTCRGMPRQRLLSCMHHCCSATGRTVSCRASIQQASALHQNLSQAEGARRVLVCLCVGSITSPQHVRSNIS